MSAVKTLREKELVRIALPREEALVFRSVESDSGSLRVDIRRFYRDADGTERPTSKGAGLKREWIAELRKALERSRR